jgi:hypothetical protein
LYSGAKGTMTPNNRLDNRGQSNHSFLQITILMRVIECQL